jgi:hypothetical protein
LLAGPGKGIAVLAGQRVGVAQRGPQPVPVYFALGDALGKELLELLDLLAFEIGGRLGDVLGHIKPFVGHSTPGAPLEGSATFCFTAAPCRLLPG